MVLDSSVKCNGFKRSAVFLPEGARRQQLAAIEESLPVKRAGQPSDIAEAAMMIMANGFMTGTVVDVYGRHRVH